MMATSHGSGAGAGAAGGAFVAMSAAIAEVAIPAAKTNDKATLFITCPFCCPCLYSAPCFFNDRLRSEFPAALLAQLVTSRIVQFNHETAKLKTMATAAFLCFCGKTSEFVIGCGEQATLLTVKVPAAVEFSSHHATRKRCAELRDIGRCARSCRDRSPFLRKLLQASRSYPQEADDAGDCRRPRGRAKRRRH